MDYFRYGDVTPQTLVKALDDPHTVANYLLDDELKKSELAQAFRGLDKMLVFILAFDNLLDRAKEWPTFADRMWEHFGYWFRAMRRTFGAGFTNAIGNLERWDMKNLEPAECELQFNHLRAIETAVSRVVYRRSGLSERH
jgi:hypothetical protein